MLITLLTGSAKSDHPVVKSIRIYYSSNRRLSRKVASLNLLRGQRVDSLRVVPQTGNQLHLAPVVGKFLAAVQTHHIGPGEGSGSTAPRSRTNGDWKTVVTVPAPKECIQQSCEHTTSQTALHLETLIQTLRQIFAASIT